MRLRITTRLAQWLFILAITMIFVTVIGLQFEVASLKKRLEDCKKELYPKTATE